METYGPNFRAGGLCWIQSSFYSQRYHVTWQMPIPFLSYGNEQLLYELLGVLRYSRASLFVFGMSNSYMTSANTFFLYNDEQLYYDLVVMLSLSTSSIVF